MTFMRPVMLLDIIMTTGYSGNCHGIVTSLPGGVLDLDDVVLHN